MFYYIETVVKMYRDQDIERWYLGLPFPEEEKDEAEASALPLLSEEEIERLALGLPLVAA